MRTSEARLRSPPSHPHRTDPTIRGASWCEARNPFAEIITAPSARNKSWFEPPCWRIGWDPLGWRGIDSSGLAAGNLSLNNLEWSGGLAQGGQNPLFASLPNSSRGIRVAAADLTGDGEAEVVTGRGAGLPSPIQVLDGTTLAELGRLFAFESNFLGGVFVGG